MRVTDNNGESATQSITITVKPKPEIAEEREGEKEETWWWSQWEPIVTALTIIGTIIATVVGYLYHRKKRTKLQLYMNRIDATYNYYKANLQMLENKLNILKAEIKREFDEQRLEETHYLILIEKVNEYLNEIKEMKRTAKTIPPKPPIYQFRPPGYEPEGPPDYQILVSEEEQHQQRGIRGARSTQVKISAVTKPIRVEKVTRPLLPLSEEEKSKDDEKMNEERT